MIFISEKIVISTCNHEKLYFAVAVKNGKIIKTILPKLTEKEAIAEISDSFSSFQLSDEYQGLAESVCRAYHGERVSFKDKFIVHELKGDFQKDVLHEVVEIPYGEVRTYKQISEAIDSKAYRAVGTAIGKNPLPIIIPCHRVVKSDLKVGGFFGGTEMKKEILENEGICIINGKIIIKK